MRERETVLDRGFISLVDSMGNDLSVVNAARISYAARAESMGEKDKRLLRYLWDNEHTSPFRHAVVTLHVKAPLFVLRQWNKHQVGCTWNEISGRYVHFPDVEVYIPEQWRTQAKDNKQGSGEPLAGNDALYVANVYGYATATAVGYYNQLVAAGVAQEMARMVLPQSMYTETYWTASLHAVMHFLHLREDKHAQWEIRQYAKAVRALVSRVFPESLALVPVPEE